MTDFFLRFNIHDDCDFGLKEFSAIYNISSHFNLNNKDELNKELKNNIITHNIEFGDIEYLKNRLIMVCNVNPI